MDLNEVPYSIDGILKLDAGTIATKFYNTQHKQTLINNIASYNQVNPDNITLTLGADGALELVFKSFKQNFFYLPAPSYKGFQKIAEIHNICRRFYSPSNIVEILKTATTEDIIFICRPDNPTGVIADNIEQFILKTKAKVLIDESYIECCHKKSLTSLLAMNSNLFIVRTFSKSYAIPGLRLGYIITSQDKIHELNKRSLDYPVSNLAIYCAIEILKNKSTFDIFLAELKKKCLFLQNELKKIGFTVPTSETYFFCIDLNSCTNANNLLKFLKNKNIFVADFNEYGLIRVSTSTKENNTIFLSAMKEFQKLAKVDSYEYKNK